MGRMNLTLTGVTFTDYLLSNVGSSAFRLEHDYFTKQDLVIRTAAGGGGTLLVEGTDFILAGEDTYLSQQVTAAVGAGRNVFLTVQVINPTYQTGNLYFSGKYVADAVEAADFHRVGYAAKSANFTVRRDDGIRTFLVTTGSSADVTGTLPALDGTNGRIRFVKVDTGTRKFILDADGSEKIGVEKTALTFDLFAQGDWVEVEDIGTGECWLVVDNSFRQLVSGEPSWGTFHWKYSEVLNTDPADANWHSVDLSLIVPAGTKGVFVTACLQDTAGAVYYLELSNSSGGTIFLTTSTLASSRPVWISGPIPVDVNRYIWYRVDNAAVDNVTIRVLGYWL